MCVCVCVCTEQVGYVMDRRVGNTGGLGALFGIMVRHKYRMNLIIAYIYI